MKDPPSSFYVKSQGSADIEVHVEYEWLPQRCTKCYVFGHNCLSASVEQASACNKFCKNQEKKHSAASVSPMIAKGSCWEIKDKILENVARFPSSEAECVGAVLISIANQHNFAMRDIQHRLTNGDKESKVVITNNQFNILATSCDLDDKVCSNISNSNLDINCSLMEISEVDCSTIKSRTSTAQVVCGVSDVNNNVNDESHCDITLPDPCNKGQEVAMTVCQIEQAWSDMAYAMFSMDGISFVPLEHMVKPSNVPWPKTLESTCHVGGSKKPIVSSVAHDTASAHVKILKSNRRVGYIDKPVDDCSYSFDDERESVAQDIRDSAFTAI